MDKSITVIGLDLAKSVFQVHGINAEGEVVVRRKLSRSRVLAYFSQLEPCLVGMEACATAHHCGRGCCQSNANPSPALHGVGALIQPEAGAIQRGRRFSSI